MVFPITYLGSTSYWQQWLNDTDALIEQWETFPKQTERNRCTIAGANGIEQLTIPVERQHGRQLKTRDIHITYQENWQHRHRQAFKSAYQHSAFYDYYAEFFDPFYTKKYNFLLDFNIGLMEVCLKLLDIKKTIRLTDDYIGISYSQSPIADSTIRIPDYYQVFQDRYGFLPDMSIIDMLFNTGPEARDILKVKSNDKLE